LAILVGVACYGVPRIIHETAGAAQPPQCEKRAKSEPTSNRLDQMFWIGDDNASGIWARTAPCDGTWYVRRATPPPDGGRWYPNDRTVDVDCARFGASYAGTQGNTHVIWSTWLHIRRGGWLPSIIAVQERRNAFSGLPTC
jgi:hypothetical protein